MNVLILTPDAVGSTLIQRLITIYMQFHRYDQPVINLHELTNGLQKYYSTEFNRELLGRDRAQWGYHQSLEQITELLATTDHYKTARLAQYHIRRRQDPVSDQVPFYKYLDDNFYIIACRRDNVFEHAISMCFNQITKKLNVFSPEDKINSFQAFYKDPVRLQPQNFVRTLNEYRDYISWADDHFNIGSYFYYDRELQNIENYVLGLPVFSGQNKIGWQQAFGMDFETWNRCHFYHSNLGALSATGLQQIPLLAAPAPAVPGTNLPAERKSFSLIEVLPNDQREFLQQHQQQYYEVSHSIERMRELGILVTTVPIKKQTLAEKQRMVSNIDQLREIYNDWAAQNPTICQPITDNSLAEQIAQETNMWQPDTATVPLLKP